MTPVFAQGVLSREQVLATAVKAEPWDDYGKRLLYNNVQYLAAGQAAATATGTSWDQLVKERIFKPLGMTSSGTTYKAAISNPRMSRGYVWETTDEKQLPIPLRNVDNIGPAGSIISNCQGHGPLGFLSAGKRRMAGAAPDQ